MKKAADYLPTRGQSKPSEYPEQRTDAVDEGHNKKVADWYMRVMTGIYGQDLMIRKYCNKEALALGRRAAIRVLAKLTHEQLLYGEKQLERDPGQWPINPGEFAKLCQRPPEHQFHVKQLPDKSTAEHARACIQKMKEALRK